MTIKVIPSMQVLKANIKISNAPDKFRNHFMNMPDDKLNKLFDEIETTLGIGGHVFLLGQLQVEGSEFAIGETLDCVCESVVTASNESTAIIHYCERHDARHFPPIIVFEVVGISRHSDDIIITPSVEASKIFQLRDSIYQEKLKLESLEKELNDCYEEYYKKREAKLMDIRLNNKIHKISSTKDTP